MWGKIKNVKLDKYNLVIAILLIVAIVLGYLIYKQNSDMVSSFFSRESSGSEGGVSEDIQVPMQQEVIPLPENITDDERELFEIVTEGVPQEKAERFNELIGKLSIDTSTLELGDCKKPLPLVLQVIEGAEINIVNTDNTEHTFSLDQENTLTIAPGESQKINASFYNGPSVYGYACDSPGRASGFISVIPAD